MAGYRVLALAYRELPARLSWRILQRTEREKVGGVEGKRGNGAQKVGGIR